MQIVLPNNSSLVVGSVYRAPNSDPSAIRALHEIVSEVPGKVILFGGDFNLPELCWQDDCCDIVARCAVNTEMKKVVETYGLVQYVREPTRGGNILDLFSNSP